MSQTTEIQIQNQAGLPFRQKMNLMLSALNTCFAGTTEPTVTEAYMNWLDTSVTPNVLKRRNAGDTAFEVHPLQSLADSTKITAEAAMPKSGGNFTAPANANKGADIASATTTDIGSATGEYVTITGTQTITSLGTAQAGTLREVRFSGILTLTHNATSLILPNAVNITTAAGDCATFRSEGSGNWRCTNYQQTKSPPQMTLLTAVNTTSGTAVDFTNIPSWAKRLTVMINGVSLSGTSQLLVQLGSGSVQNTGYTSNQTTTEALAAVSGANSTAGMLASGGAAASNNWNGVMEILLVGGNSWVENFIVGYTGANVSSQGGGKVTLSGVMDRLRFTSVNGTDTFDAGSVSLLIEGY